VRLCTKQSNAEGDVFFKRDMSVCTRVLAERINKSIILPDTLTGNSWQVSWVIVQELGSESRFFSSLLA
jgi:hypothetical protein